MNLSSKAIPVMISAGCLSAALSVMGPMQTNLSRGTRTTTNWWCNPIQNAISTTTMASSADIVHLSRILGCACSSDVAYTILLTTGTNCIPFLLEEVDCTNTYKGFAYVNRRSSVIGEPPTIGIVSLYLIESVIQGKRYPHFNPILCNKDGRKHKQQSLQTMAAELYRSWWKQHCTSGVEAICAPTNSPLDGTQLFWYGRMAK